MRICIVDDGLALLAKYRRLADSLALTFNFVADLSRKVSLAVANPLLFHHAAVLGEFNLSCRALRRPLPGC